MGDDVQTGVTRRDVFKVGGITFAGYAMSVDTVLAQAIKTDTDGIVAGDFRVTVGDYVMPVYEARPAAGKDHPIILVISEIWGVHEYIRDCARRFAKAGYYAVAPELFGREGGVGHLPNIQDVLKIGLAHPREQTLGDTTAAVKWAKTRPNVKADRVGVTGWCWGGSTVMQPDQVLGRRAVVSQRSAPARKSAAPTMTGTQTRGMCSSRIATMMSPTPITISPAIMRPRPEHSRRM